MTSHPELTPERIALLRELLEDDIARLSRRLAHLKTDTSVMLDQQAIGRVSRMDALMNQGLAQASDQRAVRDLAAALEALDHIDEGTYGMCAGCGQPIAFARLEAMPEARLCARCG
jgi:DnaK suppressor protein